MASSSQHVQASLHQNSRKAARDRQQTRQSPSVEVGDEVSYVRCWGERVIAKVTRICEESGTCELDYEVVKLDSSGQQKKQKRHALLKLTDLVDMQADPKSGTQSEEAEFFSHSRGRPQRSEEHTS
eukprot:TRINITY_DN27299_c0_g1_i1.p1 TRINITY_DN27299_c0_g1~~TRINITY_DN27299_c0_g1_i1.p1  ORF type:complete len:137 (-),score=25.36 TRINITY_DN27299_c0_g1_i1:20-397(-)